LAVVPSDPVTEKRMCPVAGAPPVVTVAVKLTGWPVTSPEDTEVESVTVAALFVVCTPELPVFPLPEPALDEDDEDDEVFVVGVAALWALCTLLDSVPILGA
jgi:hypothetical protein